MTELGGTVWYGTPDDRRQTTDDRLFGRKTSVSAWGWFDYTFLIPRHLPHSAALQGALGLPAARTKSAGQEKGGLITLYEKGRG